MTKTLSYINTSGKRKGSVSSSEKGTSSHWHGSSPASTLAMSEIVSRFMPVIAENYADLIERLLTDSVLYNPAWANKADGWTFKDEKTSYIVESEGTNRLYLFKEGSVHQVNALIRKPEKHKEYMYTKEEDMEPENEPTDTPFSPEGVVLKGVDWGELKNPEKKKGEEEKNSTIYLEVKFLCKETGTINVGFVGSDESADDALKFQVLQMKESDKVQTINAEGTWDGKGDFYIYITEGQAEVLSLSLLEIPLEEYRKQTDTHLKQAVENVEKIFRTIKVVISRISLVQSHINQLYFNDSYFNGKIVSLNEDVANLRSRLNGLSDVYEAVLKLQEDVSKLSERVSKLE